MYLNLQYIYTNLFVEYVAKNPLYPFRTDEPINNPLFAAKLEDYLMSLPALK